MRVAGVNSRVLHAAASGLQATVCAVGSSCAHDASSMQLRTPKPIQTTDLQVPAASAVAMLCQIAAPSDVRSTRWRRPGARPCRLIGTVMLLLGTTGSVRGHTQLPGGKAWCCKWAAAAATAPEAVRVVATRRPPPSPSSSTSVLLALSKV